MQGGRRGERERERAKIKLNEARKGQEPPTQKPVEQNNKKKGPIIIIYYYYYCAEIRSIGDINYIGLALLC